MYIKGQCSGFDIESIILPIYMLYQKIHGLDVIQNTKELKNQGDNRYGMHGTTQRSYGKWCY